MTRIINALAEVAAQYDAAFVDLWGCLHNGIQPFPDAVSALQAFREGGGKVVLVTNAPRPRAGVEAQLDQMGVPRECWDVIATSGDSARAAMFRGILGSKVYHLGPEKDVSFFKSLSVVEDPVEIERVALDQAEGIVCTGLFDDLNEHPNDYRETFLFAKAKGLKLLCANPDIVVDRGHDRLWCAGALAQLYTDMGGESLYFGKPHAPIYDLARRRLTEFGAISDDRILTIGDGILTDVQGAMGEGLDSLFITGGLAAGETGTTDQNPDADKLAAFTAKEMLSPTYAIGTLR